MRGEDKMGLLDSFIGGMIDGFSKRNDRPKKNYYYHEEEPEGRFKWKEDEDREMEDFEEKTKWKKR